MEPIDFKESNAVLAEDQPQYKPLPCFVGDMEVVTCWRLSLWERIKVLFMGKVWLRQINFGQPLQPQAVDVESPFVNVVTYASAHQEQTNRARLIMAAWLWAVFSGPFVVSGWTRIALYYLAMGLAAAAIFIYFSPSAVSARAYKNSFSPPDKEPDDS